MGGGPLTWAISDHIKKKHAVMMTPLSAMTIRDDLSEVERMGVKIIGENDIEKYTCEKIETKDIDFELIKKILTSLNEDFKFDWIGIAVQDHGHAPKKPDRIFRFEKIKEAIKKKPKVYEMGYEAPPKYYARMNSALRIAKKVFAGRIFIVDTKIAAIVGAIHEIEERPVVSIDVGNGHTLVAIIGEENRVLGMFEHHTGLLTTKKLEDLIIRFVEGVLTNEEVFNENGHGCYIEEKIGMKNIKKIVATGPKRALLSRSKLGVKFASPIGDVMMTGPIGIVNMIKERL
jgi:uncharacterized protein (DUF1786 family)